MADQKVTVIGVGGIGSPTAISLAKMGIPQLELWDDDKVSLHNLPNQIFRKSDLERTKVDALAQILQEFSDTAVTSISQKYCGSPRLKGIVVSAVDSMASRQEIWKAVRYNPNVSLYIEGRMGAQVLRLHTLRPIDPTMVRWYETTLYDDENALVAPCSERAIIYTVMMAASLIANQVKKFLCGETLAKEVLCDLTNLILLSNI